MKYLSGDRLNNIVVKYSFPIYLVIFLLFSMPNGFDTVYMSNNKGTLLASSNNLEIQKLNGGNDYASYARGGQDYINNGYSFKNLYYDNMWAPGMFWLHAIILLIGGSTAPAVFLLVLASALIWSGVLTSLFKIFQSYRLNTLASFCLPAILLLLPVLQIVLSNSNVLGSEPISIGAFVLGFLGFVHWALHGADNKHLWYSGFWFAMSAYFRASCNFYMYVFLGIALAAYILTIAIRYIKTRKLNATASTFNRAAFIVLLSFFVFTLPWRITHLNWVAPKYIFAHIWMDDKDLAGFEINGGMNAAACKIEPDICEKYRAANLNKMQHNGEWMRQLRSNTIKIFLINHIQWVSYKAPYLAKYWYYNDTFTKSWFNIFILVCLLWLVILSALRKTLVDKILLVSLGSVTIGTIFPHLIIHFEYRYLYPMKIVIPILFMLSVVNLLRDKIIAKKK